MELLTRQLVCDILEGKADGRVPVWYDYFAEETRSRFGARIDDILERYPDDFVVLTREDEEWGSSTAHADGGVGSLPDELILQDWEQLGRFVRHNLACKIGHCELRPYSLKNWENRNNRYAVGHWWYGYSENLSLLRGPLNALTDVLLEPDQVNRLFDGLEEYFVQLIHIFKKRYDADAIWIGDDYGMQDRSMYSSDVFRSLFKHRLRTLADIVHGHGMKFFLHSCGNVEMLIPDIIDAGIDLIHPIQPGVMDAQKIVNEYGRDIGFFMGMDVQNILSSGTPRDVASHVDELFRIFRSAERGVLASMANTIMPETPWENIESLFASLRKNAAGKI